MPLHPRRWSRMPSGWVIHHKGLRPFSGSALARSVAALKVYLALVVLVDHRSQDLAPGAVAVTYSRLQDLTSLSRTSISAGLRSLHDQIDSIRGVGRRPSEYSLKGYPRVAGQGGWAKVPAEFLLSRKTLRHFSPRSRSDLAALKLYLLVLALRQSDSNEAAVSYERIIDYCNLTRNLVSRGMSRLIELGMISVSSGIDTEATGPSSHGHNRYRLLGL